MPLDTQLFADKINYSYICIVNEMEGRAVFHFVLKYRTIMDREKFENVVKAAADERGCSLVELMFNDDDNVFEVVIDKEGADVDIADCEYVHRAVLDAFDRNVEDYSLTVGSAGIDAAEADEMLKSIKE